MYKWMDVYTKIAIVAITYGEFSVADYHILVISVAHVCMAHHEVLL